MHIQCLEIRDPVCRCSYPMSTSPATPSLYCHPRAPSSQCSPWPSSTHRLNSPVLFSSSPQQRISSNPSLRVIIFYVRIDLSYFYHTPHQQHTMSEEDLFNHVGPVDQTSPPADPSVSQPAPETVSQFNRRGSAPQDIFVMEDVPGLSNPNLEVLPPYLPSSSDSETDSELDTRGRPTAPVPVVPPTTPEDGLDEDELSLSEDGLDEDALSDTSAQPTAPEPTQWQVNGTEPIQQTSNQSAPTTDMEAPQGQENHVSDVGPTHQFLAPPAARARQGRSRSRTSASPTIVASQEDNADPSNRSIHSLPTRSVPEWDWAPEPVEDTSNESTPRSSAQMTRPPTEPAAAHHSPPRASAGPSTPEPAQGSAGPSTRTNSQMGLSTTRTTSSETTPTSAVTETTESSPPPPPLPPRPRPRLRIPPIPATPRPRAAVLATPDPEPSTAVHSIQQQTVQSDGAPTTAPTTAPTRAPTTTFETNPDLEEGGAPGRRVQGEQHHGAGYIFKYRVLPIGGAIALTGIVVTIVWAVKTNFGSKSS